MHTSPPAPLRVTSGPVLRRLIAIFVPTAALLGLAVIGLYYQDLAYERQGYERAGVDLVDLHAEMIGRELEAVKSDLLYLADQDVLREFLTYPDEDGKKGLEEEYVLFCLHKGIYDQVRYLNLDGQEIIRVNYNNGNPRAVAPAELQEKKARYYFSQALPLDRGEVFVSRFDLNVEHDQIEQPLKPTIRFATPVFDQGKVQKGVLVINYLGEALLNKLVEESVSHPGVTFLLLNRDGSFLRGPTREDEWGWMFKNNRTAARYFPAEWQQMAGAGQGQLWTGNGLFTFRTVTPPPSRPATQLVARPAPGPEEGGDASVVVLAHVPPDVLEGRPRQLLARMLVVYGVALCLILALAWYLAYVGAVRRRHEHQLAASEGRLRSLSAQLITAQEDERRRVSRDLHDDVGQIVTAMSLDLQRAGQAAEPEKQQELIGRALRNSDKLLERVHEMSTSLRPTILDDLGLKEAVQSLLGDYERATGVVPRAELHFQRVDIPPVVSENVYRILQEALTNVAKHARTAEVEVGLHVTDAGADLTVRDEGVGFAPEAQGGKRLGLLGMRERAELLDGTFAVKSQAGRGTEIAVTIPMPAPSAG
jgi:signal transduction histidine kinase